jgi:flavin reductase (DIM6/NTAB) family NADH-FMN oxidoreductase RutF
MVSISDQASSVTVQQEQVDRRRTHMQKKKLGPTALVYPMPAFLIGADVGGKPNFMTAAWSGIAASNPPMATVGIRPARYTLVGIRENGTFSVNVPSESQAIETDYCGIVSGRDDDKAVRCGFSVFYGDTQGAPLIEECPVNLECKLHQEVALGTHILVIGEILQVHVSEAILDSEGDPDPLKARPLVFGGRYYYGLSKVVARAFADGRNLKG